MISQSCQAIAKQFFRFYNLFTKMPVVPVKLSQKKIVPRLLFTAYPQFRQKKKYSPEG